MSKYILPIVIFISIITFIANFIVHDEKINVIIDISGLVLILILGFWGFSRINLDKQKNK
ncbi:hypothetical protein M3215_05320 [Bacillus cytotoxicus]|uniref:Uncharacterized protein n=1 Tax=Bacillus cytotoxicus TaxID=580165 RepID=A0ACC6A5D6_9BACI|nr:hypothetical protein [Bacillus cytotoxicus]